MTELITHVEEIYYLHHKAFFAHATVASHQKKWWIIFSAEQFYCSV